jgi:hypothetical protein
METIIKHLPLSLLSLFVLKLVAYGVTAPEMGVIFALAAYTAIKDYLDKHKRIQEISEVVAKQNEVIGKMAVEIDNLKTSIVGVKMGQGFKKAL